MNVLTVRAALAACLAFPFYATADVITFGPGSHAALLAQIQNGNVISNGSPIVVDAGNFLHVNNLNGVVSQVLGTSVIVGGAPAYGGLARPLAPFTSYVSGLNLNINSTAGNASSMQVGSLQVGVDTQGTFTATGGAVVDISGATAVGVGARSGFQLNSAVLNQGGNFSLLGFENPNFAGAPPQALPSGPMAAMRVENGSTVNMLSPTAVLGVGWNGTSSGAGSASLIVNNSVINGNVTIGANGYLGGNGTIHGNVINYGTINPGNSPGTFYIDGTLTNVGTGRLILEVASNGSGGYITDKLVFSNPNALGSLGNTPLTFALGAGVDPNTFFASAAFDVDNFFFAGTASASTPLSQVVGTNIINSFFGGATFQYTSGVVAAPIVISAQLENEFLTNVSPVPEPAEWLLMLAGLGFVSMITKRKKLISG
jgi:hypothetical protein